MFSGYFLIALSNYQIYAGLESFGSKYTYLMIIYHCAAILALFIRELLYQARYEWTYKQKRLLTEKKLPVITIKEFDQFIKNGKKYVLYDNFVIDVESFIYEHPGSAYAIIQNIGRDIGKYFYGAYHLETSIEPHQHSSYANRILEKLAVAKIKGVESELFLSKETDDYQLPQSEHVYNVISMQEIAKNIYRVRFGGTNLKVLNFGDNLNLAGKC